MKKSKTSYVKDNLLKILLNKSSLDMLYMRLLIQSCSFRASKAVSLHVHNPVHCALCKRCSFTDIQSLSLANQLLWEGKYLPTGIRNEGLSYGIIQ